MSDLNEVNHNSKLPIWGTLSKAWSLISGFKGAAWGGTAFLMLVALGVSIAIGIIVFLVFLGVGTNPETFSGNGALIANTLNFFTTLVSDFFIIPVAIGLSLLGVHRLKNESFSAYRVFEFFKWRYMWRFFTVLLINYLLIFIIAFIFVLAIIPMAAMNGGEPSLTTGVIIFMSVLGVIFAFALFYIGTALNFTNMLIAEKEMPLSHALSTGFKGVTKHFFKILGILILALLIGMAIYLFALLVGLGFHAMGHSGLGIFLGLVIFFTSFVWLLPWMLNLWALMYSRIYGIEKSEHIGSVTNQTPYQ